MSSFGGLEKEEFQLLAARNEHSRLLETEDEFKFQVLQSMKFLKSLQKKPPNGNVSKSTLFIGMPKIYPKSLKAVAAWRINSGLDKTSLNVVPAIGTR